MDKKLFLNMLLCVCEYVEKHIVKTDPKRAKKIMSDLRELRGQFDDLSSSNEQEQSLNVKFIATPRFGKMQYYPACDVSHALCDISKKRSLSERDIEILDNLEMLDVESQAYEEAMQHK